MGGDKVEPGKEAKAPVDPQTFRLLAVATAEGDATGALKIAMVTLSSRSCLLRSPIS
jgi:hypothetical protein